MIIVVILVPVLFFALIGSVAYYFIGKTRVTADRDVAGSGATTVQAFLPIADIKDGYIVLKDGRLRRVIECSSTNFDLKTDEEQVVIEMIFQRFLNSLSFPVTFYLQTRVIDNTKRMKALRDDVSQVRSLFPRISTYADRYVEAMEKINEEIGNSKQKKKFLILPFDDQLEVDKLTEAEKDDYIKKELDNRCSVVLSGLNNLGIKASVLDSEGVVELLYSTFHRDNYGFCENISEGESLSLLVDGEFDHKTNHDVDKNFLNTLSSALNIIETNSAIRSEEMFEIEKDLREIREKYLRNKLNEVEK